MSAYQTVVVGTDGSESSMKAVERAGAISGDKAQLIIACAYFPTDDRDVSAVSDVLKEEAYQVHGSAPTEEILRTARERAANAGGGNISTRPVVGSPVDALLNLVADSKADLLVVG